MKKVITLCVTTGLVLFKCISLYKDDFVDLNVIETPEYVSGVIADLEENDISYVESMDSIVIQEEVTTNEKVIERNYIDYDTPLNNSFKSYMDYRTITDQASKQYELQQQAYTEWNGIRMVDEKYCIAVGSYYSTTIGQHIDVILENGNVIPCIVGDLKKDIHTDSTNRQNPNGSIVEFIVDIDVLHKKIKEVGDISFFENVWGTNLFSGEIKTIRIYE